MEPRRDVDARSWTAGALLGLAAWAAFAALSSAHFFVIRSPDAPASYADLALHIGLFYLVWAAMTPALLVVARRVETTGTVARWTTLAALAPASVVVHGLAYVGAMRVVERAIAHPAFDVELREYALRHGGGDLATYAVLLAIYITWTATRRARERELAASRLAERLSRADLEILRWQLQPHFLFNVLNTVSTLVLKQDAAAADRAVSLISRYLRSALATRSDALVPLETELALVDDYIEIEALRFGDALRVERCIAPETRALRVPSLTLQPIVENAIRHGLDDASGDAAIAIDARLDGASLVIRVRDGAACRGSNDAHVTDGFGLRYVRERLAHFYGDAARVSLETASDGTTTTLTLPRAPVA